MDLTFLGHQLPNTGIYTRVLSTLALKYQLTQNLFTKLSFKIHLLYKELLTTKEGLASNFSKL